MPRPRCALPVRHDLRAPGYGALSSHLGSSGNPPLAAQPFSDSFVSYTDNPMMQTRGKKNHSGTVRKVSFARHKGMIIMIY